MQTPFRNDVDALKTRLTSLDEEAAALQAKTQEYEAARARLVQLEAERADLRRELDTRNRRQTPYLDTLRIASPCNEAWDNMVGDERTRFCGKCQKNVHNISEMTRDEAETFLESTAGAACVRMYKRVDGTILTADCPVGVRKKRVKRLFLATVGGGLAAVAGAVAFWQYEETVVMGDIGEPIAGQPHVVGTAAPMEPTSNPFATPPDSPRPPKSAVTTTETPAKSKKVASPR